MFELAGQGCQPGTELMKTGDWLPEGFGLLATSLRRKGTIIADNVRWRVEGSVLFLSGLLRLLLFVLLT